MPPKDKDNLKSVCAQCVVCHCIVASKWKQKHVKECSKELLFQNMWISDGVNPDSVDYGFIRNSILFATIRGISMEDLQVPKRIQQCVILLHPTTMYLCGMSIASPVLINQEKILFAWPEKSLLVGEVSLLSDEVKHSKTVTALAYTDEHVPASEMQILVKNPQSFTTVEEFRLFMKNQLLGQFVTSGQWIYLSYLGYPCQIGISCIRGRNGSKSESTLDTSDSSVDNCTESLQDLSICSSGDFSNSSADCFSPMMKSMDDSFTKSHFSTPIKGKSSNHNLEKLFFIITEDTVINENNSKSSDNKRESTLNITFSDIGGMDEEKQYIIEMIKRPLTNPQAYEKLGLAPPRGVLIFGPTGVGKTMLARAICHELEGVCHVIRVNGPEVWSKFYGETEAKLRSIFDEAVRKSPSLVLIDELESLCTKRENVASEAEKRVVATLLTIMDGLETSDRGHVIVLGTTSKPDNLDPAVRRPGRFDRELEIAIPSAGQRSEILRILLTNLQHRLTEDDVRTICDSCHGYTGADMAALVREAGFHAVKKAVSNIAMDTVAMGTIANLPVAMEDMAHAMSLVKPSTMREVSIDVPKVLWSDIGGQEDLKLKLKQSVVWPLKHPEAFTRLGIKPPKGLLMYGPPGCSKTMIAKAVATESGLNFIAIKGPELFNKWVGESERAVREVFRKARKAAPSVVFFDELDALAVKRGSSGGGTNVAERVLAQLLTELDGIESLCDVTVIAATNRPDMIDSALMRPGRIDRIVYVPLPDAETRREILSIKMRKIPTTDCVDLDVLVAKTGGYSGAEVAAICHEAALHALERDLASDVVEMVDFAHALDVIKPRTTSEMMELYDDYRKSFQNK